MPDNRLNAGRAVVPAELTINGDVMTTIADIETMAGATLDRGLEKVRSDKGEKMTKHRSPLKFLGSGRLEQLHSVAGH